MSKKGEWPEGSGLESLERFTPHVVEVGAPRMNRSSSGEYVRLSDVARLLYQAPEDEEPTQAEIWCEIHEQRVKDLEALLVTCPVCEGDFSGGGMDEPSTDCSNCNNLGVVVPQAPQHRGEAGELEAAIEAARRSLPPLYDEGGAEIDKHEIADACVRAALASAKENGDGDAAT